MKNDPSIDNISEAFSRKALVYDEFGDGHMQLDRMREKVRTHVLSYLQPGDRILELNAGTGADAVFFARRGFSVHATDISPGMVARIEEKIVRNGLQDRLTVERRSFLNLQDTAGRPFQAAISNMGGVNCTNDLGRIPAGLKEVLAPGGIVTWVVMPPVCLWELLRVLRGDAKTALRRLAPQGTQANVEGVRFTTYYYSPRQVTAAFGEDFQLVSVKGLSVLTPTADAKYFSINHPKIYRLLLVLDERLSDLPPFNCWGDFYIITFRYLPGRYAR
jgi:ubiquinone/menaquinone biosynthesis C-methylase UbiE